jgi:hypothetical protein
MPQPNALRLVVWITLSSSLLGALFTYAENRPYSAANFVNTELHGLLAGGLNGGILSSFEILVLRGAYGAPLRKLLLPWTLGPGSNREGPQAVFNAQSRIDGVEVWDGAPLVIRHP